jgi:hypothetical protein
MLICGEKVQDEVLHRAAEEHNSENLKKYKQMKSYNATNCVAGPIVTKKKILHDESSGLLRLLLEITTSQSKKKKFQV